MKNLAFASITELKKLLSSRAISTEELLRYFLNRFAQYDESLGSALEIFDAPSIMAATPSEQGALAGIPGILKDNIAQKDRRLTCASKILENFTATYDATVTARLKQEGALLVGRANMDEFAMGGSTETSAYKKTGNPWDLSRIPGGSSGGSIAAVAAGLVPWALGTETGGSVRLPAALCGVVGLKPTYGLVSRYGLVAYGSSLDQAAITTRTVHDTAVILSILGGSDAHDSTSLASKPKDYTRELTGKIKPGMKIGILKGVLSMEGMDPEISVALDESVRVFESLGAQIVPVELPTLEYGAATYFIVSRAELASNLARFDGVRYGMRTNAATLDSLYKKTRHDGFGAEVKARTLVGNYVLSVGHADAYYKSAQMVRAMMRQDFEDLFARVDLVLTPANTMPAYKIGALDDNKLALDLMDYFLCVANLTGIPGIAIPCGMTSNQLPIGLQLMGPHLSEELMLQTAHAFEAATQWHTLRPPLFVS